MRVIVLGGSGQIGSVLGERLARNHEVVSTSRRNTPGHFQFDPFRDDWSILGKTDVLINCIGLIQPSQTQSFERVHIELTRRMIDNRHTLGNPRIIQISALGASSKHRSDFLRTKGIADDLLLKHPDTVVIRPSIVCTHRTMLVKKMLMLLRIARYTAGLVLVPRGFLATRVQPVMAENFAGIVEALCVRHEHRVVAVAGPEVLSFGDILVLLSKAREEKYRVVEIPRRIMDPAMGAVSRLFPAVISTQQYELLFEDNVADSKLCADLLGRPMTSVVPFFRNEFVDVTHGA
jgi:uncharacterized protein YbjT (DUF2867 family)